MSSSEPLNTHAGLVNVGMCDGAVRSIPDEIDVAVWRAMSTMRGGEVGRANECLATALKPKVMVPAAVARIASN